MCPTYASALSYRHLDTAHSIIKDTIVICVCVLLSVRGIAALATAATATSSFILFGAVLYHGSGVNISDVRHTNVDVITFFTAYGTICFAYNGHACFPTFQSDMKNPKHFGKALFLGYSSKPLTKVFAPDAFTKKAYTTKKRLVRCNLLKRKCLYLVGGVTNSSPTHVLDLSVILLNTFSSLNLSFVILCYILNKTFYVCFTFSFYFIIFFPLLSLISVVLLMYSPSAVAAYFVYGIDVESNILNTLPQGATTTIVSLLMTSHLLFGIVIVVNPVAQEIEHCIDIPDSKSGMILTVYLTKRKPSNHA